MLLFSFSKVFAQTFVKNEKFPIFSGQDIRGEEVSISNYSDKSAPIIVLFLFSTKTGEEMATKLSVLDLQYGGRKVS